jgi:hypothetical protein
MCNISKTQVYLVTPRGFGLDTGVLLAASTDRVYAQSTTLYMWLLDSLAKTVSFNHVVPLAATTVWDMKVSSRVSSVSVQHSYMCFCRVQISLDPPLDFMISALNVGVNTEKLIRYGALCGYVSSVALEICSKHDYTPNPSVLKNKPR